MHFNMTMDLTFFRNFFVDNESLTKPLDVVPKEFDGTTPVVVIDMGNRAAGEILGVSKIKNGNRMATTDLDRLCVVYRPTEGKATVWISPKNGGDW